MSFLETEWMLECARFFLNQIIDKANVLGDDIFLSDEIKYQYFGFINATRCVTFYMEKEFKHIDGFLDWYKPRVKNLDERWVNLRNITQKEHSPQLSETIILDKKIKAIQVSPEITVYEPVIEIAKTFVTLRDLDTLKSAEEECKIYLTSLSEFVAECLKEFGLPYEEKVE